MTSIIINNTEIDGNKSRQNAIEQTSISTRFEILSDVFLIVLLTYNLILLIPAKNPVPYPK